MGSNDISTTSKRVISDGYLHSLEECSSISINPEIVNISNITDNYQKITEVRDTPEVSEYEELSSIEDSVGTNQSNEEIHRKRICLVVVVVVVVSVVWAVIFAAVVLGLVFGPNMANKGDQLNVGAQGCYKDYCLNGGTCADKSNNFSCACMPGYAGSRCEKDFSMLILRNDLAGSSPGFFNRSWTQYQQGFGSPTCTSLYWIGLDRLHQLTQGHCQVRFDLQAINGTWYYANYTRFSVGNSSTNYTLTIGGWSGDTGSDAMVWSNGRQFSTYDADHDPYSGNCASIYGGGFWFSTCASVQITVNNDFMWYTSTGWMSLNTVQVSLLCQ